MLHLSYFTDVLAKNNSLRPQDLEKISLLVHKTSDSAWNKSAVWSPFPYDGCSIGVANQESKYPKFHWWWGKEVTVQIIPPDPRYFFHRRKLGCMASNGSQPLWKGRVKDETACMEECRSNQNCSKYQFQIVLPKHSKKAPNCWLWSFNRSDHTCRINNPNLNIGIKRPVGNATCLSKCNSKEPQAIDYGYCYCDSDCAFHMDCCLDYADHCQPHIPLCKGNCTDLTPKPIVQGGYCWCFDGCNGWFTDNNSDGSCCSDYPQQCMYVNMPVCLDGRSQGSALNLFLAQIKVTDLRAK